MSEPASQNSPATAAHRPESGRSTSHVPRQLADADRTWQQGIGRDWLMSMVKWLAVLFLLVIAADLIWQLDGMARLLAGAAFVMVALSVLVRAFYVAFLKSNPLERIARTLESREPSLGSRLINLLQLKKEADNPAHTELTRGLAIRAIDDAAASIDEPTLNRAADRPPPRRCVLGALIPPAVVAILALAFLPITRVEVLRFLDPFGDHPPYSFTRLAISQPDADGHEVVYGDPLLVRVDFEGHTPDEVTLSAHDPSDPGTVIEVPMIHKGEQGFVQQLDQVTSDLVLVARTSNERSRSSERRIAVQLTPRFRSAEVTIHSPDYTGLAPSTRPWDGKPIRALQGSVLNFRLTSNRPLGHGLAQFAPTGGDAAEFRLDPVEDEPHTVAAEFRAEQSGSFRFSIEDIDGQASEELREGPLTVTFDLPPRVEIAEPNRDSFVVETHRFAMRVEASDDYGIRTLRIHRAINEVFSAPLVIEVEPQQTKRRLARQIEFDLPTLGVEPGDILSFFAEAIDNAPEPHLVQSAVRHLMIISEEEYNDSLRTEAVISDLQGKYDELLGDFEDLVEQQKELTEKIEALQQQLAEATTDAERQALQEQLDQLLDQQTELNDQLLQQAERMENFIRDEPLYDIEKSLQEMLAERAEEIRDSVEKNQQATDAMKPPAESSQSPSPSSPSPGGPSPEALRSLAEAAREHRDNLAGGQQQAQQEVSQPIEDVAKLHEIVNDYNHFKALYEAQQSIARQAAAYDTGRELSDADRLALQNLAAQERELGNQLDQLSDKLREDAEKAADTFPKAAESAADLADQIDSARMPHLAEQSSGQMLDGNAPGSNQAAERLRAEMEKLFGEACSPGQMGEMSSELDSYFQLKQMAGSAATFQQMMQSRRFGFGNGFRPGQGQGQGGAGSGLAGMMSSEMGLNPNMGLMGGESLMPADSRPRPAQPGAQGADAGSLADGNGPEDAADSLEDATITTRPTESIDYDTLSDQYRSLVDEYFKALTTAPETTAAPAAAPTP